MFIVGISGCTCSGKTTLANRLHHLLKRDNILYHFISQDDYYKEPHEIEALPEYNHWRYDEPESIIWDDLQKEVERVRTLSDRAQNEQHVCVVEGNQIHLVESVRKLFNLTYFVTLPLDEARARRLTRNYEPPDVEGYFDGYVWPCYEQHLSEAQKLSSVTLLDGEKAKDHLASQVLIDVMKKMTVDNIWVQLQHDPLDINHAVGYATEPGHGAISLFIGTTRDNFESKTVVRLEYEAYNEMALKQLRDVCEKARQRYPDAARIAVFHRLGVVPVCESSVVIAVGCPHRESSLKASEFIITELKKSVPIWKKEIYADESSEWKQNKEYTPK